MGDIGVALAEYAALEDREDAIDAEKKGISKRKGELEKVIMPWFTNAGIQSLRMAGGRTLYLNSRVTSKLIGVTKEQVAELLKKLGHADMVSIAYNTNSLNALLTEMRDGDGIPAELAAVLEINALVRLGSQRGDGNGKEKTNGEE